MVQGSGWGGGTWGLRGGGTAWDSEGVRVRVCFFLFIYKEWLLSHLELGGTLQLHRFLLVNRVLNQTNRKISVPKELVPRFFRFSVIVAQLAKPYIRLIVCYFSTGA